MENARRGSRPRKFNTAEKAGERRFEKRRDDAPVRGRRNSESRDSDEKRDFRKRDERPSSERGRRSSFRSAESSNYGEKRSYRRNDSDRRDGENRFERSNDDRPQRRNNYRNAAPSSDGERRPFRKRSFDRSDDQGGFRSERGERKSFGRPERNDGDRQPRTGGDRQPRTGGDRQPRTGGYSGRRKESTGYEKRRNDTRERRFNDSARDERRDFDKTRHYDREERFERKKQGYRSERFESRDENGEIRLNRYIAQSGICSRREADEMIALGEVKVNGKVVTEMGTKVTKNDTVIVNEELVKNEKLVYLVLNKPKGFITSLDDPEGRDTVMELIKHACKERIYPVGRLDRNTTGILLFTNDGDLAKKLTHPSHQIRKVYHVCLDRALTHNDMQQITEGVLLEDGLAKADVIAYVGTGDDKKEVGVELHSGKNRIVRRIFEHLDYKVVKLDRVSFAGITKKDLPRGRWRFLEDREISFLKMV